MKNIFKKFLFLALLVVSSFAFVQRADAYYEYMMTTIPEGIAINKGDDLEIYIPKIGLYGEAKVLEVVCVEDIIILGVSNVQLIRPLGIEVIQQHYIGNSSQGDAMFSFGKTGEPVVIRHSLPKGCLYRGPWRINDCIWNLPANALFKGGSY